MHIFLGYDHNGFALKDRVCDYLVSLGHTVENLGSQVLNPDDDYPIYAAKVAEAVSNNSDSRGILICGSGGGVCVVANKFPGIYAVNVTDTLQAKSASRDDHANVLCLGSRVNTEAEILDLITTFLQEPFGEGRHRRRFEEVKDVEERNLREKIIHAKEGNTGVIQISPSLLSCDLAHIQEEINSIEELVDRWHFDVMDEHFVPNLTFGLPLLKKISSQKPIDAHLMVENPAEYIADFAKYCDIIYVHIETLGADATMILKSNNKLGLTLKPSTDIAKIVPYLDLVTHVLVMTVEPGFSGQKIIPSALERISYLKKNFSSIKIAVDGGVNDTNVREIVERGADTIISGSYIFDAKNREAAIMKLRVK